MSKFKVCDRVCLTDIGKSKFISGKNLDRKGYVHHLSSENGHPIIKWDHNKYQEGGPIHPSFIQLIEE